MELKKNPNKDVGRNSSIYFSVGHVIMLLFTWLLIEHKTYVKPENKLDIVYVTDDIEEDIPITKIQAPPPPPPTIVVPDVIKDVKDEIEIEEAIFKSTETDQDEGIEVRNIVEIEDVEVEEVEEDVEVPFVAVEKVPIFPGCSDSSHNTALISCFKYKMTQHVKKHFKYPEMAIENNQQGKVYVMFAVDKDGEINNIPTRGPYQILEKEANRIISLLPKMEPEKQRGKPVKVSYSLPISFKLMEQY